MTSENMLKVQQAASSGNYQIVCRPVSGAIDSWYITLTDISDWNWGFNEYRIYVGTKEPPMTNEMNSYSVYFCGYTYYYIDTDGQVKKITNVNFTEYGAQYTSFLRCSKVMVDQILTNENSTLEFINDVKIDKGLTVESNVNFKGDQDVSGSLKIKDSINLNDAIKLEYDMDKECLKFIFNR